MSPCGINGCRSKHNRMLHSEQKSASTTEDSSQASNVSAAAIGKFNEVSSFLQIAPVSVRYGRRQLQTYAFMDTGSTVSFIDKSLRRKLQAEGNGVTLNVVGIHGTKDLLTEKVRVTVKGLNSISFPVEAFEHKSISMGNASYNYEELKDRFDHLTVLPNHKFNLMEIGLILGQDVYDLQRPLDYRIGKIEERYAMLSKLGWVVSEPMTSKMG